MPPEPPLPLEGVRVLELGTLLAGPVTSRMLAEFGAEVIKVEPPSGGDPLRSWRGLYQGHSLWWYLQSRNKKCITLDLRQAEGQELARSLAARSDVLVENFRPGTLERWGLGYEELRGLNRGLVMVRISGYGQTGPQRHKAGFAAIGEAIGGIRYLTGFPDRPPVRTGVSLGDSLAAMWGAFGALAALRERDHWGEGQVVDVALHEAIFALTESLLPEYHKLGYVRERSGAALPGIAPSNTYTCGDGKHLVIGGNNDSIYGRLMRAIGRPDLAGDPRLQHNAGRVQHVEEIDAAISAWAGERTIEQAVAILDAASVPAGPIYSIADIVRDPLFHERGMIEEHETPEVGTIQIPGVVPRLSRTPGRTRWVGPPLGAHNREIYGGLLGLREEEIAGLTERGVI